MNTLDDFVYQCQKIFKENLKCVLLLGSGQREEMTPFSDLDLVIVLGTMDIVQTFELRAFVRSLDVLIDCSIICQDEIPNNPENFRLGTHGCYHLELVLKHAKCVWGTNVLLEVATPGKEAIRRSVAEKVAEYTWWTRRMFIESNRESTLEANYKLNSRIIKLVRDLVYLKYQVGMTNSIEAVISVFVAKFSSLLTSEEERVLTDLLEMQNINANVSNMSDGYFLARYSIVNKIYKEVARLVP